MASKIIIIGAGVSGLSAAWRLSDSGTEVEVLEAEQYIGGLASTIREEGCSLDFGAHCLFSEDAEVLRALLGLFDEALLPSKRDVKFYYNGTYLDYPFSARGILHTMGLFSCIRTAASFARSRLRYGPLDKIAAPLTVEACLACSTGSFGRCIYGTCCEVVRKRTCRFSVMADGYCSSGRRHRTVRRSYCGDAGGLYHCLPHRMLRDRAGSRHTPEVS